MDFRNRAKVRIRHLIRTFQGWSKALGFRTLIALASFIGVCFRRCLGCALYRGSFPPCSSPSEMSAGKIGAGNVTKKAGDVSRKNRCWECHKKKLRMSAGKIGAGNVIKKSWGCQPEKSVMRLHRVRFRRVRALQPVAKISRCGAPRRALSWQVDASIDR